MKKVALLLVMTSSVALAAGADSARMTRAKDLIADEQWRRAVKELRAAFEDPAEPAKDEAAFWLAHSLYQSGDAAGALETIEALERRFSRSRWVFPARSLKLEIAHRLNRTEMLWEFAIPPAPPAPAVPPAPPAAPMPRMPPAPAAAPAPPAPPARPAVPAAPVRPRREWVSAEPPASPELMALEMDLRIQALGSLMRVEPARAVPLLKTVALDSDDLEQARRAMFLLMQSNRIDARRALAEIARSGPEPITMAAVKELGFVRSPESTRVLADVYETGSAPVKAQVIRAYATAGQPLHLMRIIRMEREPALRETAVAALGQAGARTQLAALYRQEPDLKRPVISALVTAAGEEELIAIAQREKDPKLRAEAIERLKLFGTPRARAFLETLRP